jgi:hypothetical protein
VGRGNALHQTRSVHNFCAVVLGFEDQGRKREGEARGRWVARAPQKTPGRHGHQHLLWPRWHKLTSIDPHLTSSQSSSCAGVGCSRSHSIKTEVASTSVLRQLRPRHHRRDARHQVLKGARAKHLHAPARKGNIWNMCTSSVAE